MVIAAHVFLPDEKMTRLYKDSDWDEFSAGDNHYLKVNGINVPYAVFENADDLAIGDDDLFVVARGHFGAENLYLLYDSGGSARLDKITDLERTKDNHQEAGRKICQRALKG